MCGPRVEEIESLIQLKSACKLYIFQDLKVMLFCFGRFILHKTHWVDRYIAFFKREAELTCAWRHTITKILFWMHVLTVVRQFHLQCWRVVYVYKTVNSILTGVSRPELECRSIPNNFIHWIYVTIHPAKDLLWIIK